MIDEHGEVVPASGSPDGWPVEFVSDANYEGRRVVVGVDEHGDDVLLTPDGRVIDDDIDWAAVERIDRNLPEGDPIAIGDYFLDPRASDVDRVYLFSDGSQATRSDDGEYVRVIVPTDAEYPDGRAVFEGDFHAGIDRVEFEEVPISSPVFVYADGQTATWSDGELVLADMAVDTTPYPDGPPVACGKFPGGDLFVFPDGRQLLREANGSWGVGTFTDLPEYDELVEVFGPPDLAALDGVDLPELPSPGDLLLDDITGGAVLVAEPAESETTADPQDPDPEPELTGGVEATETPVDSTAQPEDVVDPLASDPTDLDQVDLGAADAPSFDGSGDAGDPFDADDALLTDG